ncbi:anionic cell wall polymer biosynthesis LytR-Cps2A-Psr (LCP) family protein [Nonomuraea muscovyensis]|uniref:Anionic cell wall polymer biosynthesis LytR-Cps2A-Psr (LCP) family protein n=1 Tax=Nonomuraea muscovyensis TaxID=1124761 RepID=A0A7X0EVK5_9ACTN|nr:LCP family protein [Nonomuraea muscovyensis]MBB6345962.1 anionic cell wall polymer biosynthesis LytR-Cps2A-Psr (LCP) family protein [Nonomuraea muscovyensis]
MTGTERGFSPVSSIALTLGSALLWGVAHLATDRRRTGLALMAAHVFVLAVVITAVTGFGPHLLALAVQPAWLTTLSVVLGLIALAWSLVIIRSFVLVRPAPSDTVGRALTAIVAAGLCATVLAPTAYAARMAYLSRDVVQTLFTSTSPVVAQDPWNGAPRINFLLLGGDSAPSRPGVRTDSMTVASVNTATGATVLFGLPRNLQRVPLPVGPARDRFPSGFAGAGPETPGLLNEVFQYAEDHPEVVPGVRRGQRGPALLKQTVGDILGLPVSYYALVDMRGFAQIIDAMGGVKVTIKEPIVYGKYREGLIAPGTRKLSGSEALWYGRSRTDSDDYVRMGRQKCLLNAVARQADPITVINSFEQLATATKRAISTDIPQGLLPPLVDLAHQVKDAKIRSLNFVPPLVNTAYPDWDLIRDKVAEALADGPGHRTPRSATPGTGAPTAPPAQNPEQAVALDAACG